MTPDDLARAAYEAATVATKAEPIAWKENTEEGRWLFRQITLAVAEKLAEAESVDDIRRMVEGMKGSAR